MRLGLLTAPFPETPLSEVVDWTAAYTATRWRPLGMLGAAARTCRQLVGGCPATDTLELAGIGRFVPCRAGIPGRTAGPGTGAAPWALEDLRSPDARVTRLRMLGWHISVRNRRELPNHDGARCPDRLRPPNLPACTPHRYTQVGVLPKAPAPAQDSGFAAAKAGSHARPGRLG